MNQFEQHNLEEKRKQSEIERKTKEWNRQLDQVIARNGGYFNTACIGGIEVTEWIPNRRYNSMD